jgi:hypothetical protein
MDAERNGILMHTVLNRSPNLAIQEHELVVLHEVSSDSVSAVYPISIMLEAPAHLKCLLSDVYMSMY